MIRCGRSMPMSTGATSLVPSTSMHQSITVPISAESDPSMTGTSLSSQTLPVDPSMVTFFTFFISIHVQRRGAGDAGLVHRPGNHCRVAGGAAGLGQDAGRLGHPRNVVRRRFMRYQNARLTAINCIGAAEHRLAGDDARAGRQAGQVRLHLEARVDRRAPDDLELVDREAANRRLLVDQLLGHLVDGNLERRLRRPLA